VPAKRKILHDDGGRLRLRDDPHNSRPDSPEPAQDTVCVRKRFWDVRLNTL
jgi:hypothetical protein